MLSRRVSRGAIPPYVYIFRPEFVSLTSQVYIVGLPIIAKAIAKAVDHPQVAFVVGLAGSIPLLKYVTSHSHVQCSIAAG